MIFNFLEDRQFYGIIPFACKVFHAIIENHCQFRTFASFSITDSINFAAKTLIFQRASNLLNLEKLEITIFSENHFLRFEKSFKEFQICKSLKELKFILDEEAAIGDRIKFIHKAIISIISYFESLVSLKITTKLFEDHCVENFEITKKIALNLSQVNLLNLQILSLPHSAIEEEAFLHLSQAKWPCLQHLCLKYNEITISIAWNHSQASWENLQYLDLSQNRIKDAGASYLSKANWPHLKKLRLNYNEFKDSGALHLSEANWENLQYLDFKHNKITDTGVSLLSRANWPLKFV